MIKNIVWKLLPNGCWHVTSHSPNRKWHPTVHRDGKQTPMSRYIYEVLFGFLPDEMKVRHTCDNPHCINPEHLIPGTQAQNIQDSIDRGRHNRLRGEKHILSKLKEADIQKIRDDKRFDYIIAKDYGVTAATINKVKLRMTWAWF